METSLRYAGDSKALRIHAKQKFSTDTNSYLEFRGELDTKLGTPTLFSAVLRQFYPDFSARLGVGVHYNPKGKKHHYTIRAKKAFAVTTDGFFNFCVKAQGHVDQEFRLNKYGGAAEFVLTKFDFKKGQDLRLKFGYQFFEQVPYLQIRENNWTLNADVHGRWNLRYDL